LRQCSSQEALFRPRKKKGKKKRGGEKKRKKNFVFSSSRKNTMILQEVWPKGTALFRFKSQVFAKRAVPRNHARPARSSGMIRQETRNMDFPRP